jgi:hypothetical protein
MPLIANLTLAQLRAATKAQIITAIANYLTNNFTKRQIIGFLMDADVIADPPTRTFRADGQIESETDTDRDAETGAVVASRQIHWSYYPTGEIDTITIDQDGAQRVIKHYLDGHQPTVSVQTPLLAATPAAEPEPDMPQIIVAVLVTLAFAAAFAFYLLR